MFLKKIPIQILNNIYKKPKLVIFSFFIFTILSIIYSINNLSVITSTEKLISDELNFKIKQQELRKNFPILSNNIIVVIKGEDQKAVNKETKYIIESLKEIESKLDFIFSPNLELFFKKNALLLMDSENKDNLINQLFLSQPYLSEINNNPRLHGLNNLFELILEQININTNEEFNSEEAIIRLDKILMKFSNSMTLKKEVNWKDFFYNTKKENLIILKVKNETLKKEGLNQVYAFLNNLKKRENRNLKINFTGGIVLDFEEVDSVVTGASKAGILSLIFVSIILWIAFRNILIITSLIISLIVGLILTLGLTTIFIGSLNIISVAFAVLFIGISVDFGIQLALRLFELEETLNIKNIKKKIGEVSSSLLIVGTTSMIGFLSFIPTSYIGLSELGLISSFGIIIGLLTNMILLPSLLISFKVKHDLKPKNEMNSIFVQIVNYMSKYHKIYLFVVPLILFIAYISFKDIHFDSDPIKLKDQNTQSVITALELMEKNPSSDYTISVFQKQFDKEKISKLKENILIKDVFMLSELSLDKEILDEISYLHFLYSKKNEIFFSKNKELERFKNILIRIKNLNINPLSESASSLYKKLSEKEIKSKEYEEIQSLWFMEFDFLINDILLVLNGKKIDYYDIPEFYKERYFSKDGYERIEIIPSADVTNKENLRNFVNLVQDFYPDSTGMPVIQLLAGDVVIESFVYAFTISIIFLFIFTFLIFRRFIFTFFCLIPLFFSALISVMFMKAFKIDLNFANMISLPLLFSLGTSYSIYIVKRAKDYKSIDLMLSSSTPNAVFFSGLTTIGSFGTLSISNHSGTSSMGILLFISLAIAMISCLILLPLFMKKVKLVF